VQIHNSRIIYSPNSKRTVDIPPSLPHGANLFSPNPKLGTTKYNYWGLDVLLYEQPQWYHTCFGWISFYDKMVVSSSTPLINVLHYSGSHFIFDEEDGHQLPSSVKEDWLRLDSQLNCTYEAINHHSSWFGVWMAFLSYYIAVAQCTCAHVEDSFPKLVELPWQEVILKYGEDLGMDCIWLDMLLDTPIVNFTPDVSRTGTFIKLDSVDIYELVPSVEWFMEHGIPVWYEWDAVQSSQVENRRFAPLEYQLQNATTFRTKSLSPVPSSPTNTNQFFSFDYESGGSSSSPPTSHAPMPMPNQDPLQFHTPILMNYMEEFFRA
jgi:hypothetical protein